MPHGQQQRDNAHTWKRVRWLWTPRLCASSPFAFAGYDADRAAQSLDWSVIGGTGALYTPFFAQASYFLGLAVNMWIIQPLLYFNNFWQAKSFDSPLAAVSPLRRSP